MERRRTVRLLTGKALVALGRADGTLMGAGWPLLDISEGGLRFAIPKDHPDPPKTDEKVIVTVEFAAGEEPGPQSAAGDPERGGAGKTEPRRADDAVGPTAQENVEGETDEERLRLHAFVRRVADAEAGDVWDVSLEFTDLTPKARERLRGTVLDLAMEKIASHRGGLGASVPEDTAPEGGRPKDKLLGEILVTRSAMTHDDLESFLHEDYQEGTRIGRQLVKRGLVEDVDVARALAEQADLHYADLEMEGIDLLKIRQFTEGYLAQHLFVPLAIETDHVTVASANPLPEEVFGDIKKRYGRPARNVISSERQIMSALQKAFHISRNQRLSARFPAGLSLRYKFYDEKWKPVHSDVMFGLTKNLSENGVLFLGPLPPADESPWGDSPPPVDAETHIGVHLFLPNQPEPIRAPCLLVRATIVRPSDPKACTRPLCLYAVKVLGVSDEDRRRLNLFRFRSYLPQREQDGNA